MYINPEDYASTSAYDLLKAASRGHVGYDHRLLHALADEPDRSVPDLVRFAAEEHDDDRLDLDEDLVLLALYLRRPEMIPFLIEQVRGCADDVPDMLVEAVCGFREAALEPLLRLHAELDEGSGSEAPFLLASLGVKDPRIEEVLEKLSETDPEDAAFCLGIYREISGATAEIEEVNIWEEYPETADPPFEILPDDERLEFLGCESPSIRAAVAESFANEDDPPAEVLQRLVQAGRNDPEPKVRGAAWRTLALEADNESLRREMKKRLLDAATPDLERAGLAVALSSNAGEDEVRKILLALHENPETRAAALEAMWRSMDRTFTGYVKKSLNDPDNDVREQAVMGVGYLGMVAEVGRVKAMIDDPNLRPAALLAYSLVIPSDISTGRMKGLFRRIEKAAGGLDGEEADIVRLALDNRLQAAGKPTVFNVD